MESATANTARLPWHPPMIYEFDDHDISPPAARPKFWLDRKYPPGSTWPDIKRHYKHELELAANRQDRWRERGRKMQSSCLVDYDDEVVRALVRWGVLASNQQDDAKEIGKAISELLVETVKNEKPKW
jgi:hypothetical protein